jgi:hypothetical protein
MRLGWLARAAFLFLAASRQPTAISRQPSAISHQENQNPAAGSYFIIDVSLPVRLYFGLRIVCGSARNHDSEKNLFRKVFPKQIPNIHKARASRITFALVHNSSERKLRTKLNGDYRLHFRAEPSG